MVKVLDLIDASSIALSEYVELVKTTVDVSDPASIIESAGALRALANDRSFILNGFHSQIKSYWSPVPRKIDLARHSIMLAEEQEFYVRANIWDPMRRDSEAAISAGQSYAYGLPHDHNFHFLSVGYFGCGYKTDLYSYDNSKVTGYVGEEVEIHNEGETQLSPGRLLFYEASRDIHVQHSPENPSISVNLMCRHPSVSKKQQFIFDTANSKITSGTGDTTSSGMSILEMTRYLYNDETVGLLIDIAKTHSCVRTRAYALSVINDIRPSESDNLSRILDINTITLSQKKIPTVRGISI